MLAQGRRDLAHDRAARPSAIAFGVLGALLTIAGVVSVVTGMPSAAHGLAPLAGIGTLGTRYGEFSLLLSSGLAAIVAGSIVALMSARRLHPGQAGIELIVLGAAIEVCILAAGSRVAYAVDGSVLPATVACMTGGAAIVASGVVSIAASIVAARPPR